MSEHVALERDEPGNESLSQAPPSPCSEIDAAPLNVPDLRYPGARRRKWFLVLLVLLGVVFGGWTTYWYFFPPLVGRYTEVKSIPDIGHFPGGDLILREDGTGELVDKGRHPALPWRFKYRVRGEYIDVVEPQSNTLTVFQFERRGHRLRLWWLPQSGSPSNPAVEFVFTRIGDE
jgi:hypothetical protein